MPLLSNITDLWNNAGQVFRGIKLNITNTASAAGSLVEELQVGGSTVRGLDLSGNQIVPKASGVGVKIDPTNPVFGWRDLIGVVQPKATGAGAPTRATYAGGVLADYSFVANDLVDINFHIPHDYVPGSDLYIHVHWSHTGTSISGNAQFTIYHSFSKGFNQENFTAEKNVVITYATTNITTTPRYRHRVDEVQLSTPGGSATLLDSNAIEVDGLIMTTLQVTSLPTIGGAGRLFIHTVDVHYQSSGVLGTKNKAPNFYT